MQYKINSIPLQSRRGNYNLVTLPANPLIWEPRILDLNTPRHLDVITEVTMACNHELHLHKYWQNEPDWNIEAYQEFYTELFSLAWIIGRPADRYNIMMHPACCLTLVQFHQNRLIAYSRSTDMRNGYFSDRLVLDYLAQHINEAYPESDKITSIEWFMAIPHVYEKKGIARLSEEWFDK
jgi:hypothetical protein